jgi:hypothetical protein
LIRADIEVRDGAFGSVSISGDFFCFPPQAVGWLESALYGQPVGAAGKVIAEFYSRPGVEVPGVGPADWAAVLKVEG